MDKFLAEGTKTKLKGLAYYQIVGGVFGIGLAIWAIAQTITISGLVLLIYLFSIGLYSFSIYCGQQILKGDLKRSLKLSTINQAIQIILFSMFGYAYKYIAGAALIIGIDLTGDLDFIFNLEVASSFQFSINMDKELLSISVNFVAVLLVYFIGKLQDQVENNRQQFDFSQPTILDSDLMTSNQPIQPAERNVHF